MNIAEEDLRNWIATQDPALWLAVFSISSGYVSRFHTFHPERDDLVSEGTLHAMRYASTYDPSKGTSAFSWLTLNVSTAVNHYLDRSVKKHRHKDLPAE